MSFLNFQCVKELLVSYYLWTQPFRSLFITKFKRPNFFLFQKVDARKLEKAEAKLQQKQQKQKEAKVPVVVPVLQTATASQVTSKKDNKLEAKGTNRTQDIRIENFDIAYGDR